MKLTRIPLGPIAIAAIAMVSALCGTLRTDGAAKASEVAKAPKRRRPRIRPNRLWP